MNQISARDTNGESMPPPLVVVWYLCVRPAMIAAIPTELIWLAVIVAMVMAGFVASAPE